MATIEFTTTEIETEEWRPVVGWEGRYEVSNLGRVKSLSWHGHGDVRLLTTCIGSRGYPHVGLGFPRRDANVHILVAAAFHGVRPPARDGYRIEVNHKDGIKANCRSSNLEYVTQLANMQHAAAYGLMPTGTRTGAYTHPEKLARGRRTGAYTHPERLARGSASRQSKLTEDIVEIVWQRLAANHTHRAIAETFGVSARAIGLIAQGKTWRHITRHGSPSVDW